MVVGELCLGGGEVDENPLAGVPLLTVQEHVRTADHHPSNAKIILCNVFDLTL